jgi:hypothetical protein
MMPNRECTGNRRRSVYDELSCVGRPVDFAMGETRFGGGRRNSVLRFRPAPQTALSCR